MMMKAMGGAMSRIRVAAMTKRTMPMLSASSWTIQVARKGMTPAAVPARMTSVRSPSTARVGRASLPARERRLQGRAMTLTGGSLVDPAHDGVETGQDGHEVGDEGAGHHLGHGLQVEERRIAEPA